MGPVASLAILTQQISNYHAARFRAARNVCSGFSVISVMNGADFPELLSSDVACFDTIRLFEGWEAYVNAIADGKLWMATWAALGRLRPNVVAVAGWSFPESLSAIAWAHENNARVVMMSESQEHDSRRSPMREAVKARIVGACDAALVSGRRHLDYIVQLGMRRERVFYGYSAVDNGHFAEGADRARVDAASLRRTHALPDQFILASARFIPKKNLERLIEAFARAVKLARAPHALVILGGGPGRPALQSAIMAVDMKDRILLPGFKSYACLPAFYGLADAFVHVSVAEQWGLVINEAAAAGLPLIVSRPCGAACELVEPGLNGYLVEPTDTEDIARALQQVMVATDAARQKMGRASRRIVAEWDLARFAKGLRDAADVAFASPKTRLATWDRLLMRTLSRRYMSDVS
jgi:glycosyltransferase involved in cell wall biosynthesis